MLSHAAHGRIFLSGKWSQSQGSPRCEKRICLVMLRARFVCSGMSGLSTNGPAPPGVLQEEGSVLGFTGNLLGSVPAMGWKSHSPGSREAQGQQPKEGVMPFPRWDAQITAVNVLLYKTE